MIKKRVISEKAQKELLLDMLGKIDNRCRENGYTYWLYWGTLLGVIRHKGMIPWDDDIDIAMPRDDYEAFKCDVMKKPLAANVHFIDSDHPVKGFYPNAFGKIGRSDTVIKYPGYGEDYETEVSIDVFPMDSIPENESTRLELADKLDYLTDRINRCIFMPDRKTRSTFRYYLAIIRRRMRLIFKYRKCLSQKLSLIAQFREFEESEYCGFPSNINVRGRRLVFKKEWHNTIYREFEGREYPIPEGYDYILEIVFPDYMKLPPVQERVSHHDYSSIEWR